MRIASMLAGMILLSNAALAADGFSTVTEFQADFDRATPCKPIKERRVWKGEVAYYWQAPLFYTNQSGAVSKDVVNPVPLASNTKAALAAFVNACK